MLLATVATCFSNNKAEPMSSLCALQKPSLHPGQWCSNDLKILVKKQDGCTLTLLLFIFKVLLDCCAFLLLQTDMATHLDRTGCHLYIDDMQAQSSGQYYSVASCINEHKWEIRTLWCLTGQIPPNWFCSSCRNAENRQKTLKLLLQHQLHIPTGG